MLVTGKIKICIKIIDLVYTNVMEQLSNLLGPKSSWTLHWNASNGQMHGNHSACWWNENVCRKIPLWLYHCKTIVAKCSSPKHWKVSLGYSCQNTTGQYTQVLAACARPVLVLDWYWWVKQAETRAVQLPATLLLSKRNLKNRFSITAIELNLARRPVKSCTHLLPHFTPVFSVYCHGKIWRRSHGKSLFTSSQNLFPVLLNKHRLILL